MDVKYLHGNLFDKGRAIFLEVIGQWIFEDFV